MSKTATIIAVRDDELNLIPDGASSALDLPLMDIPQVWAGPRPYLEIDPTFRQVIPYVIVKQGENILVYVRNTASNENRLQGKASIGVGGHIDISDAVLNEDGSINLDKTIMVSALRELKEELGVSIDATDLYFIGVIKTSETEVDRVHFGDVILWDLTNKDIPKFTFENTMSQIHWLSKQQILDSELELETWTKLSLDFFQ